MPLSEEQIKTAPDFWITKDLAQSGALRRLVGFRCVNTAEFPVRVRVSYGPQGTIVDWWTPLGRANDVLQVGESVTASLDVPAGQADSFAVYAGLA